jgi:hypothetical protein
MALALLSPMHPQESLPTTTGWRLTSMDLIVLKLLS